MKYSYLLCLLLLQSCFYELPQTGRQKPNDADLEDKPTNTLIIVDYYNPTHVHVEPDLPLSEVVIDYHPEVQEELANEETTQVETSLVETIPVTQEPVIVLPVSPEIIAVAPVIETEPTQDHFVNTPAVPESTTDVIVSTPVIEIPNIVAEDVVEEISVITNDEPITPEVAVIPEVEISPVIEPIVETVKEIENIPVVVNPVVEVMENVTTNPIIEVPVYPQVPLITSKLIPAETQQIVSLFVFYAALFNKNIDSSKLIIEIEEAPSSFYIAYCSKVNNNQNPKIKMNKQVWGSLTSSYREMLLFHELGHCLLNRPHQGNDFNNPSSIMNASLFSDLNYKTNYDYFIKELFGYSAEITEPILFGALYEHIH